MWQQGIRIISYMQALTLGLGWGSGQMEYMYACVCVYKHAPVSLCTTLQQWISAAEIIDIHSGFSD